MAKAATKPKRKSAKRPVAVKQKNQKPNVRRAEARNGQTEKELEEELDLVEEKLRAAKADPAEIAALFLEKHSVDGNFTIRYWADSWWKWSHGKYRKVSDKELGASIFGIFANEGYSHAKRDHVANVLAHVQARVMISSETLPPSWIGPPKYDWNPDDCVMTKNAIIHLPTFVDAKTRARAVIPSTPRLFNTAASRSYFQPKASKPMTWLKFLESVWPDDKDSIRALQLMFGYLLTPDTRQQKIFAIIGKKRSGKGTIVRVLEQLIGPDNVAGPRLDELGTEFALQSLLGKTLATVSDARSPGPCPPRAIERLLAISGEDKHTVQLKFRSAIDCRLPLRFLLLSNELPRLTDASGVIVSRMIVLHTKQSFYGREDTELTSKLRGELPGIVYWAIEGWKQLQRRGSFIQPKSGLEQLEQLEELASPVTTFVRQCCTLDADARVLKDELFEAWVVWCKKTHHKPGADSVFARDLRAMQDAKIGDDRPRSGGKDRPRYWTGIQLKQKPR